MTAAYHRTGSPEVGGGARSGQSLVESCLLIAFLCLLLFGLFQVSQLYAAREVLDHAATAAARARAVGFNDFMVFKVARAATIPNAGRILEPIPDTSSTDPALWASGRPGDLWDYAVRSRPSSPQLEIERSRIPHYLGGLFYADLPGILDYERWPTVGRPSVTEPGDDEVHVRIRQDYPLTLPFHRAFYADDEVRMEGDCRMDNHYPLYLE